MSAVFGSYDGQLENTSSMSDVADVFRTHCAVMLLYYLALIKIADMICCLYHLTPKNGLANQNYGQSHFQFLCPHYFGGIKTASFLLKPLKGIVK